ncbi:hypothetical protein [Kribbella sp. NPDC055071]
MTVMGERSPEAWTTELQRTGRVVFPLRRRSVLLGLAYVIPVTAFAAIRMPDVLGSGRVERISIFAALVLYAVAVAAAACQLIVQRPVVVVDREGIRRGRKFLPWTDIGAIGLAGGPSVARRLPIIPKDAWAKDLTLHSQHVRDLPALRLWLEALLKQHQTPADAN